MSRKVEEIKLRVGGEWIEGGGEWTRDEESIRK